MHSNWLSTKRLSAVIIQSAPGYEQARVLIGSLLTGYQSYPTSRERTVYAVNYITMFRYNLDLTTIVIILCDRVVHFESFTKQE